MIADPCRMFSLGGMSKDKPRSSNGTVAAVAARPGRVIASGEGGPSGVPWEIDDRPLQLKLGKRQTIVENLGKSEIRPGDQPTGRERRSVVRVRY